MTANPDHRIDSEGEHRQPSLANREVVREGKQPQGGNNRARQRRQTFDDAGNQADLAAEHPIDPFDQPVVADLGRVVVDAGEVVANERCAPAARETSST